MIELKCIAYRIPLEELERAAQGVPMEDLNKITEPEVYTPDPEAQDRAFSYYRRAKRKRSISIGHANEIAF